MSLGSSRPLVVCRDRSGTLKPGRQHMSFRAPCAAHELFLPESHLQSSLMMTATIPSSAWTSFLSDSNPPTCALPGTLSCAFPDTFLLSFPACLRGVSSRLSPTEILTYGERNALHGPRAYQFRRLLQTQMRDFDEPIQLRHFSVPRHLEHLTHASNRNSDHMSHTSCTDPRPAVWYHVDSHLVFYLTSPEFVTAR